ncbi:hypothetical protein JTB14_012918 [Gonioctena quinquepunctata]|nr:hypothetical protein JTB14_012918 [Gonioctena quinquepunctata]
MKGISPPDMDDETWEQIKHDKQKRNDRVTIFIAHVENMFSRLSRPPHETTKTKIINNNLLFEYHSQLALQDIYTVEELGELTKEYSVNETF